MQHPNHNIFNKDSNIPLHLSQVCLFIWRPTVTILIFYLTPYTIIYLTSYPINLGVVEKPSLSIWYSARHVLPSLITTTCKRLSLLNFRNLLSQTFFIHSTLQYSTVYMCLHVCLIIELYNLQAHEICTHHFIYSMCSQLFHIQLTVKQKWISCLQHSLHLTREEHICCTCPRDCAVFVFLLEVVFLSVFVFLLVFAFF